MEMKRLTCHEVRRIAINIAKLPELLKRRRRRRGRRTAVSPVSAAPVSCRSVSPVSHPLLSCQNEARRDGQAR
jgi:hypothetical protein